MGKGARGGTAEGAQWARGPGLEKSWGGAGAAWDQPQGAGHPPTSRSGLQDGATVCELPLPVPLGQRGWEFRSLSGGASRSDGAGWPGCGMATTWDFQGTLVSLSSTVNISWYVPYRVLGNDKVRVETRVF